jgi:Spy/CpxP family protein refolding chaperone
MRISSWKAGLAAAALALSLSPSAAQSPQPYAGLQSRTIKALSEQQIADLKAGRGMSLALAAELNGYPGPMHVLEHADALDLFEAQRTKMQGFMAAMKAEAVPLGEQLIAQEARLDRQFADKTITPASLTAALQEIGSTQAALRAAHLKHHLLAAELLTPAQLARYAELRGYAAGDHDRQRHPELHHRN